MKNIFIACDTSDPKKVNKIIKNTQFKIKGYRIGYKFGLEFFYSIKGRQFISRLKNKIISYKSLFIEWCQKTKKNYLYQTQEDNGNEPVKYFSVKLFLDDKLVAKARHTSKKKAEEKASKRAFFMFQEDILNYQNQNS